jgi:hypothetical protein
MNLTPFVVIWALLATGVILLAVYRFRVANRTDELIHVHDAEANVIAEQMQVAKKLESIDRWGKVLTAIVFLAGLALLGAYMYKVWLQTSSGTVIM